MVRKTAFLGHRHVYKEVEGRIKDAVEEQIADGCKNFIMGTRGEFDGLALRTCRAAVKLHPQIKIEVFFTSYKQLSQTSNFGVQLYGDVETVVYDVENVHFKRRITESIKHMLDECDTLICCINKDAVSSSSKQFLRYAEKKGLKIINLYRKEDNPFYHMTKEEYENFVREILYGKSEGE